MKIYHLLILHPGMSSFEEKIHADGYWTKDGCYEFFVKEVGRDRKGTICSYPICSTIIESIKEK